MAEIDSVYRAIYDEMCPRCHQGKLFVTGPLELTKFHKMHSHCQHCGQIFEPEPGFYFGAMFVSYALLVGLSVSTWLVLYFAFQPAFVVYIVVIIILNVLLLPFIFRYSRVLYLFGFGGIRFNKNSLNN